MNVKVLKQYNTNVKCHTTSFSEQTCQFIHKTSQVDTNGQNRGSHLSISEFRFIKSITTQSAFTHIPETMSHSREFTELKHGTVMTCLATKSALLQGIRSITAKWNCLGITATQPQSVRPHQVTAYHQELRHILCHQRSENSITLLLTVLTSAQKVNTGSFSGMGFCG